MKNLGTATIKFGNEWLWWLIEKIIQKARQLRDFLKRKFVEYFLQKDLTKDQLQT